MDQLYNQVVNQHLITLVTVRYAGSLDRIHGVLTVDMTPTANGYTWSYIDSNSPNKVTQWEYKFGDTFLHTSTGSGAPYIQMNEDLTRYPSLIQQYCSAN